jgi:hypothetical protein
MNDSSKPKTTTDAASSYDPFKLAARRVTRMGMLSGLALTSAALGAACSGAMTPQAFGAATGGAGVNVPANEGIAYNGTAYSDVDIVNFALNLEYLEAEFYNIAVNGKTIEQLGVPTGGTYAGCEQGPTTGGKKVSIPGRTELGVFQQIAHDELEHVLFLRSVLGKDAVAKPAIDLDALGLGFGNAMQFMVLARAFEDTGTSAYAGAAPLISSKDVLGAAARILATEGFHIGSIRTLIAQHGISTNPPGRLDGKDELPPPSGSMYFDVDPHGLAMARTFAEVTNIVKPFFPNGVNGVIK